MSAEGESERLKATAVAAVRAVGDRLVAAFRRDMAVEFKRDRHDVVTAHDRAAERTIVDVILRDVPDSTIVGEEGGQLGEGRVHWYIDPIDGTSNFSRGIALWCVSVGAVIDGRVVAGAILDPIAGHLFSADLTGAWLGTERLHVKPAPDELDATVVTSFPSARDVQLFGSAALAAHGAVLSSFQAVRNLGSAAQCLAHVAAGWADASMAFSTSPWDVAAGSLILEQARGRYLGYAEGVRSAPAFLAPDFLAVGGTVYPTLQHVVESLSHSG